uniref:Uncharacterized protein n=1 Tax=Steinernema glaseri TaxID=37863 RepID=A0A1I7Z1V1_9BILA
MRNTNVKRMRMYRQNAGNVIGVWATEKNSVMWESHLGALTIDDSCALRRQREIRDMRNCLFTGHIQFNEVLKRGPITRKKGTEGCANVNA